LLKQKALHFLELYGDDKEAVKWKSEVHFYSKDTQRWLSRTETLLTFSSVSLIWRAGAELSRSSGKYS